MTTLQITRPKEWQNKMRKYNIYVDNEKIGEIANGETKDFILPEGQHTVIAKIDWCSSPEIIIDAKDADVRYLKVSSNRLVQMVSLIALPLLLINFYIKMQYHRDFILYFAAPIFLILIYKYTLGRKKYLTLQSF